MVRLDVIATRGGDGGETSLGDGARARKDSLRVEALGAVDEANAAIGLVRLHAPPEEAAAVLRAQNDLFDLGADLCVPGAEGGLRMTAAHVSRLEAELSAMNAALPPLRSFVVPGGPPGAAHAHLARTLVRRAERAVVRLSAEEAVNPEALRYLNRLSDHLFVLSRRLDLAGHPLWVPGQGGGEGGSGEGAGGP